MTEMGESPFDISVTDDGRVQIVFDNREMPAGDVTMQLDPETAESFARDLRASCSEARQRGTTTAERGDFSVDVRVSPNDMVNVLFDNRELPKEHIAIIMLPDEAEDTAEKFLVAAEQAKVRRIQKETN